jgi:hypothetical protein
MKFHRLAMLAALLAVPALAAPGGRLGTLQRGYYMCELPGDATGPAGIRVPAEDFTIVNASSYETPLGRGSYLLTGQTAVMTSGPKQGERFHRESLGFLRKLDANGEISALRCIRQTSNNR